jgi:D-alanine-D-alanine ligase
MRVTVLRGGPSNEREVSLISGKAVAQGLRIAGHSVFESDIDPDHLDGLNHPCDVVFPVLHGLFGESGELQEILERRGIRFVGSGSISSRLGMNKVETKKAWQAAGLPTPSYRVARRGDPLGDALPEAPASCVVKAIDGGSSIDVVLCKAPAEMPSQAASAIRGLLQRHEAVLVEQFIDGIELTVGLLEEKPLAPIRIIAKREFFDYEAKYKASDTEHRFDTGLPEGLVKQCQELAQRANEIVGARDLARVDMMIDRNQNPFLLEINTMPGFTPKSLLPEAAAHEGIGFPQLVDRLVRAAAARADASGKVTVQLTRRGKFQSESPIVR